MTQALIQTDVRRITHSTNRNEQDLIATEEPLEIRLGFGSEEERIHQSIAVTMRTPGEDVSLAIGFLFSEGIIQSIDHIEKSSQTKENVVRIDLKAELDVDLKHLTRNFFTNSSCGVCGKAAIESIWVQGGYLKTLKENNSSRASIEQVMNLPEKLKAAQHIFSHTGGLHAAALFNLQGDLQIVKEDIGRHNALDKLIGAAFQNNLLPLSNSILLLSGRASFELIQKASLAGCAIVASVGAPSSLALSLAKDCGITLIGFLRKDRCNIYCNDFRFET